MKQFRIGLLAAFVCLRIAAAMPPNVTLVHQFSERGELNSVFIDDNLSPSENITMAGTSTFGVTKFFLQHVGSTGEVTWSHAWGNGDRCYSMSRASDSTALLIGSNVDDGEFDYKLMHADWDGTLRGNDGFGEPLYREYGRAIIELVPDSFLVTGRVSTDTSRDLSLLLIDIDGDVYREWTYEPGISGNVMELQGDSLVWIYGESDTTGGSGQDFLMLKTSTTEFGAELFSRTFGGDAEETLHDAVRVNSDLTILVGSTRSYSDDPLETDIWVVATNDNGDSLWSRNWGGAYDDAALGIIQTADYDTGFVIAGYTTADTSGIHNAMLMKFNEDGDSLWSIIVDDTIRTEFNAVTVDSGYHYHAVGVIQPLAEYGFYLTTEPDPAAPIEHPPNPFALLAPTDEDTLFDGNIVFEWEVAIDPDPNDEVIYALLMDSDTLFDNPIAFGPLSEETYTWETDTDDVVINWRVVAQDIDNNLTICSDRSRSFLRVIPDETQPFSLLSPEDNEVLVLPAPEFRWEKAEDADIADQVTYDLVFEVRDTSFAIEGLVDTFVTINLTDNPVIMQSDTVHWHVVANSLLPQMSGVSTEEWTFVNWNEPVTADPVLVSSFGLGPVYPNPFNASTTISYNIDQVSRVRLEIFSVNGRLVETLVSAERWPGQYTARWSGTSNGTSVGSGMYFVRLTAGNQVSAKKLMLLK